MWRGKKLILIFLFLIVTTVAATAEALEYKSYVFTTKDIIFFSYEDGTQVQIYNTSGQLLWPSGDDVILQKGEHARAEFFTTKQVYEVTGSNRFAVLMGDANTAGVSGYYAMDANGLGVSTEFYTYVPDTIGKFIVFAYEDDTEVTVQQQEPNGNYVNCDAPFDLNDGEHWASTELDGKYIHVMADKPVSVLTCYDHGYFVPSADGGWSGTKFYTYVSDRESDNVDLTVIAYDDETSVSIKDSNTDDVIWSGTLDGGEPCVLSYPDGNDRYFTIASDKTVTVSVQPWKVRTSAYEQGVFIPDRDGTGVGRMDRELIGSTLTGGYLYVVAHTNRTHIKLYDSETGADVNSYTLNKGESQDINPGNGLWKIVSDRYVSAYSGNSTHTAEFAPLAFDAKDGLLELTKTADFDGNCVSPDDYVTYTISYDANGYSVNDVEIIDYLPEEVDFNSATGPNTYDSDTHTVTWNISDLNGSDSGSVSLSVRVSELAKREGIITNQCEMESDSSYNTAEVNVPVCYWCGGAVIYVDVNAPTDQNNGVSWEYAFIDLQDALDYAQNCDCNEIWVAVGTYEPSVPSGTGATYSLLEGVAIYGGFAGGEVSLKQRNWIANESILDGNGVSYVVTAVDVNGTAVIDGFTITNGTWYGISCENGSPGITNCKITGNGEGVHAESSGLTISKCIIQGNGYHGIYTYESNSIITNNWIYDNGASGNDDGIYLRNSGAQTVVRNNTIVDNANYGIRASTTTHHITNCIIWGHDGDDLSLNLSATYSCIEDCNDASRTGNICGDANNPRFVDAEANDYHLDANSPCIDVGTNEDIEWGETDIDGEERRLDHPEVNDTNNGDAPVVDMGADEFYWSPADFNNDGNVNFVDYAMFAEFWGMNDTNEGYNDLYDLIDNDSIDNNDLGRFCEDWLWKRGRPRGFARSMGGGGMGGGMALALGEPLYLRAPATAIWYEQQVTEAETFEDEDAYTERLIKSFEELLAEEMKEEIGEDDWEEHVEGIKGIIEALKSGL